MNGPAGALLGLALTPIPLAVGRRLQRGTSVIPVAPAGLRVLVVAAVMALAGAAVVSATSGVSSIPAAVAAVVAASAAAVDLAELRLPNVLTYVLIAGGAVVVVVGAFTGQLAHPWLTLLAGAGYGLVMLVLALVGPRGGYGLGDVKLAAGLGIWVGLDYPTAAAGALLYGQLLILATLLVAYGASRRRPVAGAGPVEAPLGPAILAGSALAVLLTG